MNENSDDIPNRYDIYSTTYMTTSSYLGPVQYTKIKENSTGHGTLTNKWTLVPGDDSWRLGGDVCLG